ncbi:uncharacterized protein AMSG_01185 [Thecamonas trahens ATCC 50062]|uniref:Retinoblastoma-associated protein A-box domain-containing protein n=1 Tax=Thecamonas trahens ATCC 50062 TaxID=461836 RepID=A0A0L0DN74_THETB|nr:hypothetical protein AMSG_01185 [Thecamonas trahens ATCC 50062]KNC53471.1 hypothetical protein AMSG_01185 [Thecamonas trahens ATCC 50062]|eukprot:XP_013761795.1 hypothetical protein AMSG_01185 [Thecamonas trahens ATCC 50062]
MPSRRRVEVAQQVLARLTSLQQPATGALIGVVMSGRCRVAAAVAAELDAGDLAELESVLVGGLAVVGVYMVHKSAQIADAASRLARVAAEGDRDSALVLTLALDGSSRGRPKATDASAPQSRIEVVARSGKASEEFVGIWAELPVVADLGARDIAREAARAAAEAVGRVACLRIGDAVAFAPWMAGRRVSVRELMDGSSEGTAGAIGAKANVLCQPGVRSSVVNGAASGRGLTAARLAVAGWIAADERDSFAAVTAAWAVDATRAIAAIARSWAEDGAGTGLAPSRIFIRTPSSGLLLSIPRMAAEPAEQALAVLSDVVGDEASLVAEALGSVGAEVEALAASLFHKAHEGFAADEAPEDRQLAAAALYLAVHAQDIEAACGTEGGLSAGLPQSRSKAGGVSRSGNKAGGRIGATGGSSPSLSLTKLLREAETSLLDFFGAAKSVIHVLSLDGAFDAHLKMVERGFVVATILFQKYDKVWAWAVRSEGGGEPLMYSLGWHLFVLARDALLGSPPDLVNSYYLLLSVVAVATSLLPGASLSDAFAAARSGESVEAHLRVLAGENRIEPDHLVEVYTSAMAEKLDELLGRWMSSAARGKTKISAGSVAKHLHTLLGKASAEYSTHHEALGGLDERTFLSESGPGGGPLSGVSKLSTSSRKFYAVTPPRTPSTARAGRVLAAATASPSLVNSALRYPESPSRGGRSGGSGVPATPMSSAHSLVRWLRSMFDVPRNGSVPVPDVVARFVEAASAENVTVDGVSGRAAGLVAKVDLGGELGASNERAALGLALYYEVLHVLLESEEARLGMTDFSALLASDAFHTALVGVSLEVVIFSYKVSQAEFPAVLGALPVDAFHFVKILDSFITAATARLRLPEPLRQHLREVEESVLDSHAWQSVVLERLLSAESPYVPAVDEFVQTTKDALLSSLARKPVLRPADLYAESPRKPRTGGLGSGRRPTRTSLFQEPRSGDDDEEAAHDEGGASSEGKASGSSRSGTAVSLEVFMRKVLGLLFKRLTDLCARLGVPRLVMVQSWEAVAHVLVAARALLWRRHLDVLVICTLYGVARANSITDYTFKKIIEQYRAQPQASSKVYKSVLLEASSGASGDIIAFYNQVYIPAMKPYLLKLQTAAESRATEGDLLDDKLDAVRVGQQNLFLSPLRSRSPARRSGPAAGARYDFGLSPAKRLHEINRALRNKRARSGDTGSAPGSAGGSTASAGSGSEEEAGVEERGGDVGPVRKRRKKL